MGIRLAEPNDVDRCVYIAGVFHDVSQFANVTEYRPEDATRYANLCLENKRKLFMVYEKNGEVVGFFIASRHPVVWNSKQFVSSEELFFVLPEHQSPRVALRFFKAWERWCKHYKVVQMSFTPTSFVSENLDRWDGFCRALDYVRGGVYYKKVLNHAD
jgi:GNAT superfamily N-acetyltransferase